MGFCFDWWILLLLTLKSTHYLRYMILRFVLTNHMYVYCRLAHLKKKCWFSAVYYRIWLEGYQIIFVRSSSLAKGQQTFKIKPVNIQSRSSSTLRTPADMELRIYLKPYKTDLQNRNRYFCSYNAWKNNYCSYLNWYKYLFHFELLAS